MKIIIIMATSSMGKITRVLQGADMWDKAHCFADVSAFSTADGTDISKLLVAAEEDPEIIFCGVPGVGNYFDPTIREVSFPHEGVLKTAMMHYILSAQGFEIETDEHFFITSVK